MKYRNSITIQLIPGSYFRLIIELRPLINTDTPTHSADKNYDCHIIFIIIGLNSDFLDDGKTIFNTDLQI
jgi:hypothetical protein